MENNFKSPHDWSRFCKYLISTNRYVLNKEWSSFINSILNTAKKREVTLEKGVTLVRARIGQEEIEYEDGQLDIRPLPPNELGAPPIDKAEEGRINPRGISYIYLTNNTETAIAEVRPWLKESISVGYFKTQKALNLIDTSQEKRRHYVYTGKGKPHWTFEQKENGVWGAINYYFSKPVSLGDRHRDYIPTQYISEVFKLNGYAGILYKSSLTKEGNNIVLFNPKTVKLFGAKSFQINSLKYEYKEDSNPYSIKENK